MSKNLTVLECLQLKTQVLSITGAKQDTSVRWLQSPGHPVSPSGLLRAPHLALHTSGQLCPPPPRGWGVWGGGRNPRAVARAPASRVGRSCQGPFPHPLIRSCPQQTCGDVLLADGTWGARGHRVVRPSLLFCPFHLSLQTRPSRHRQEDGGPGGEATQGFRNARPASPAAADATSRRAARHRCPDAGQAASMAPLSSSRGDGHPRKTLLRGQPGSALLWAPDPAEGGRHPGAQGQSSVVSGAQRPARAPWRSTTQLGGASRDCRRVPVLLLRLSPGPRALSAETHLSIITEHTAPGASPFRSRHLLVSAWA